MPPPRKKDRLRAVCPRCGNNFRPQGRSAEVKRSCRAKAARTRAQKQPPAEAGSCAQAAPMGEGRAMGAGAGKAPHWAHAGAEGIPGAKTAPAEAGNCAQAAPMGERRASCVGWCLESTALGDRRGRGYARAQKQPPAGPEAVWMRDMGVTCPGRSV